MFDDGSKTTPIPQEEDNSHVRPEAAQGGMLKTRLIDLVNLNCMIVETDEDVTCLMCDTIDDYIKYEQHRLNLVSQVKAEDMKTEKRYYGNVILLKRLSTTTLYQMARKLDVYQLSYEHYKYIYSDKYIFTRK